jgi:osmoprotectant transport system permease protein
MSSNGFSWLFDGDNWKNQVGQAGIPYQLGQHIQYAAIVLVIAAVIALPTGLAIGHAGRGGWFVSVVNGIRALPTTGLLILCYVILAPHFHGPGDAVYLIPTVIVLVLLAVPPILANTYAGLQNVDPAIRDAAYGMGMTSRQVLFRVELPNALPLLFSGLRSATLQVIATATVAAYIGLQGLGRFVYDGLGAHDLAQTVGGSILVALLALVADGVWLLVQRLAVSPGVSGRAGRARRTADSRTAAVVEAEVSAV